MKFRRKKGEDKLYEQWVKHGDLPPDAIPQKESPGDAPVGREKNKRVPLIVFISLGAGIAIWGICLALLFMESC
jgi:hypothetical protein